MKKYPAKILLFGEHTVNLGSQALAMPLPLYGGSWAFSKNEIEGNEVPHFNREKWVGKLLKYAEYLDGVDFNLNTEQFKKELSAGLFFDSDVPLGYGAGSSGALVAGVFDRYYIGEKIEDLSILKNGFSQMENFFHGKSSGTDPLICYLNSAVVLSKKEIRKIELRRMPLPYQLFLLDTKIERQATPFIEWFLEKNKDADFRRKINRDYLPKVNLAIESFIDNDWPTLFYDFHKVGEFHFFNFKKMIPDTFLEICKAAVESEYFKLKICGAGGGGFILGMTDDFERMKKEYTQFDFLKI